MNQARRIKIGAIILAIGSLGLSGASAAILSNSPEVTTTIGRLMRAGALANLCLSLLWSLIALIPLRWGEKWAFWAFLIPIPLYGIPLLYLDATYAPREGLVGTLAPQVGGLLVAAVGLILVATGIFKKTSEKQ
ncbi:MAG: hypothetical protein L0Z48_10835 [candidate division Zixibacteria bacterium]|nr:hypothetical protein [candidate division Zixibacteria bacterium]MCI0597018.1 hypothetical protein [candidate division Zixibacteria bacterium]